MIPWVQVYSNLIQHPKTSSLADELGLSSKDVGPNIIAAGMMVSLWLWAAQNATSGDLSKCTDRAIAEAAGYKKKPAAFVAALTNSGFLDDGRKLHDWDEYATLLIDMEEQQRQKTKERVQKHRASKKAKCNAEAEPDCNADCNVTQRYNFDAVTPCNAPTIPNHTIPNLTINNNSGGDGVTARGRAASDDELFGIGIMPGDFFGVSAETVAETRKTTDALFSRYLTGTAPKPWDYRQVFKYCGGSGRACLLDYAFEKAAVSGKPGDWRYVHGIMDRLFARDIKTPAQAREWDESRPDLE